MARRAARVKLDLREGALASSKILAPEESLAAVCGAVFAGRRPRKPDVYSLIRKIIKDPPTQAVENITPLQKTSHMLCSWATADTGVASLTKCVQTDKSENYAWPKNGAVGGHFATV